MMYSCENKVVKKMNVDEVVSNELKQISFEEVDIYPSFSTCETNEHAAATKACFVETLHQHLAPFFENHFIEKDSLDLVIQIDKKGKLNIAELKSSKKQNLEGLKLDLNRHIEEANFSIYPAQKQGIPVHCSLVLPVIITN